jgi:hypothetical protein
MKKLAFGALCIGLFSVAACGGGSGDPDTRIVIRIDGGDGGSSQVCNVANNTGCPSGQKCTWVRVSVGAMADQQLGQVACAPEGTAPVGGACSYGMSGVTTGFDDCIGGAICMAPRTAENATGTCKEICSLLDTSNPCDTGFACGPYQKYFTNGGMGEETLAGVCDATCNPLTQERDSDSAPACGSTTPGDPTDAGSQACYGLPSRTTQPTHFSCAGIFDHDAVTAGIQNNNTHRTTPSQLCLNCCAPGNVPLYIESDAVQELVCFAFCKPADTNNTLVANAGGNLTEPVGNPGAWTCPNMGATNGTEECRYLWFFEGFFNSFDGRVPLSPASDAYGFCWDPTLYNWDPDGDGTFDTPWTSCTQTVRSSDPMNNNGDAFWGCVNSTLANSKPNAAPRNNSPRLGVRPVWSPAQTEAAAKAWFEGAGN